jgi:hypothetical protein
LPDFYRFNLLVRNQNLVARAIPSDLMIQWSSRNDKNTPNMEFPGGVFHSLNMNIHYGCSSLQVLPMYLTFTILKLFFYISVFCNCEEDECIGQQ